MALIKCKDCGGEVSTTAARCPACGWKVPRVKWWLWGPLAAVAAFLTYGASIPEYKARAMAERRACEQLAHGTSHLLNQCSTNYSRAISRGR